VDTFVNQHLQQIWCVRILEIITVIALEFQICPSQFLKRDEAVVQSSGIFNLYELCQKIIFAPCVMSDQILGFAYVNA
jgi:hypothetical protein